MNNQKRKQNFLQKIKIFGKNNKFLIFFVVLNVLLLLFITIVYIYSLCILHFENKEKNKGDIQITTSLFNNSEIIKQFNKISQTRDNLTETIYNISEQINKIKKEYSNNENEIKRNELTLEKEKMNYNYLMGNLKIAFSQLNINYTLSQINPTLLSFNFYKYNYKGKEYRSSILVNNTLKNYAEMITHKQFGEMCFSSLKDTLNGKIFRKNCGELFPTLTLIKTSNDHIIGGYINIRWDGQDGYYDTNAFLINFTKMKIYTNVKNKACISSEKQGLPSFGEGDIIWLGNFNFVSKKLKSFQGDTEEYEINEGFTDFYPVSLEVFHMV